MTRDVSPEHVLSIHVIGLLNNKRVIFKRGQRMFIRASPPDTPSPCANHKQLLFHKTPHRRNEPESIVLI